MGPATACADAGSWLVGPDGAALELAVNISALQLGDLQVGDDVLAALTASGRAPGNLILEVTETAEVVDLTCAQRTLGALDDLGLRLALDDFGTGHSSLTYVQALPFHTLKVDRSFVAAAAAGDRKARATIAAVGALAGHLDVDVVAEGVEDVRQLAELRRLGCGYGQGFGLLRPVTPELVTAALTSAHASDGILPGDVVVPAQR